MSNSETTNPLLEIISRRVFAMPRELVFAAFADPQRLATWWGPKGFTNTFHHFDFRPGGKWRFVMHAPDGTSFPNESEFIEVVAPEKIVFIHLDPVHRFQMAMTFAERGAETELTWRMSFESPEPPERRAFIVAANEQNFDRLEACLLGQA